METLTLDMSLMTALKPQAGTLVATPVLGSGEGVRCRLSGHVAGTVFVREMAGPPLLPTGRERRAPLRLARSRRWQGLREPTAPRFGKRRLILQIVIGLVTTSDAPLHLFTLGPSATYPCAGITDVIWSGNVRGSIAIFVIHLGDRTVVPNSGRTT